MKWGISTILITHHWDVCVQQIYLPSSFFGVERRDERWYVFQSLLKAKTNQLTTEKPRSL
ncbi:hypothetical protein BN2475_170022 [Paraburkholderia ribeironis]|uniref:Uncharacterized protein n=1 Tax=Paraburkholderia ribeironis TaxID=1247936 RepID=A0A1N7RUC1_9BURK|nr:hypothetical protein BN2475_170022 [Paraburkholderia ribeironis]